MWKSQQESYKEAIDYIKKRSKGEINSLVTPWSKLNDASADGIEWNSVTLIGGRPGCLAGDVQLYISNTNSKKGEGKWYSLEALYYKFNGFTYKGNKWDTSLIRLTQSYKHDQKLTGLNQIIDVYESGVKPVYLVKTEKGKSIKATLNHRFLVDFNDSYKELKNLKVGDNLVIKSDHKKGEGRKVFSKRKEICGKFPYYYTAKTKIVAGKTYQRFTSYRAIYDAGLNKLSLKDFLNEVKTNPNHSLKFSDKSKDIHHIDGNHNNNELSNLKLLSKKEHNLFHSNRSKFKRDLVEYDKIISIEYSGDIMTYDIEMKSPYNNFIANGIVVHNSGKTLVKDQIVRGIQVHNPLEEIRVLDFSLEMVGRVSATREFSALLNKPYKAIISCKAFGSLPIDDMEKINAYVGNVKPYVDVVEKSPTVPEFVAIIRKYMETYKKPTGQYTKTVITVDHSILLSPLPGQSQYDMLMDFGKAITILKKEYPILFIVLSQLGRGVDTPERNENGKYGNYILESDIYMGDLMMQFSDMVIGMNRPGIRKIKYYGPDRYIIDDTNVLVWHFLKARNGDLRISFFKGEFDKMRIVEIPPPLTQNGLATKTQ